MIMMSRIYAHQNKRRFIINKLSMSLKDRSVTYIARHNETGTLVLVLLLTSFLKHHEKAAHSIALNSDQNTFAEIQGIAEYIDSRETGPRAQF